MNITLPIPEFNVNYLRSLNARLKQIFNEINTKVVRVSLTAAPTTGKWKQGDVVYNSTPSELGTTPNKYVITGWICVTGGEPGTWVETRALTGN